MIVARVTNVGGGSDGEWHRLRVNSSGGNYSNPMCVSPINFLIEKCDWLKCEVRINQPENLGSTEDTSL